MRTSVNEAAVVCAGHSPIQEFFVGDKHLARFGNIPHLRSPWSAKVPYRTPFTGAPYLHIIVGNKRRGQELHRLPLVENL